MAFLDNSGDIILDAVLTDTGRKRLAKGDGSFKIDKFALGDDEIDYSLYENKLHSSGVAHASGSAYYDLNIMMTPILEAFTNNTSSMKSKLLSLPRTNLLFLPIFKMAIDDTNHQTHSSLGVHVVTVDNDTVTQWKNGGNSLPTGVLNGVSPTASGHRVRIDQGIDNDQLSNTVRIDADLNETQYIVEMDNRLGAIINDGSETSPPPVSYIDDDNVASYYFSRGDGTNLIADLDLADTTSSSPYSPLAGPRGTKIVFKIKASVGLNSGTYLFDTLGATNTGGAPDSTNYQYIDTNIRITGATTGASIDIPVRYVKKA